MYILDARTATPHFPGIGRYTANLAAAMVPQLEASESLAILHPSDGAALFTASAGPRVQLIACEISPFSQTQQWRVPRMLRSLNKPGQRTPVYHSTYYLMPYSTNLPTVLTFYDLIPLRYPQYVSRRARLLFRMTMSMALNVAARVVTISEAGRSDLLRIFKTAPGKVTAAPLAPDPQFRPQPPEEIARIRAKYALPEEFLLYVGINKPHKNLVALIQAFAESSQQAPTTLVLAGPWDDRYPEAKTVAEQLPPSAPVRFLGRIAESDLPALYAAATAFVFPSKYEGFGLPVLEAMACGTPVACSNTSSLPEVAGDAAFLFDPTQPAAIAAALTRLTADADLRADLRARGFDQAARFTWQATAAKTLAIYRQLAP